MKKAIVLLMACVLLTTSAFASEIPTAVTVQNLNGSQQYIKTFTIAPHTDPVALMEAPFDHEGYTYTYSSIVKEEHHNNDKRVQEEVVVIETAKKDLSAVLAHLSPTLQYAEDGYTGTLTLDHTTITTQAAGYTNKSYTVTETKEVDNLASNDLSYVPSTAIKEGKTLPLASVDWQVQATSLVGDILVPSQYKAVATYSSQSSYRAATGYITTATYAGEVSKNSMDSITYTITYAGEEIPIPVVPTAEPAIAETIVAVAESPLVLGWLSVVLFNTLLTMIMAHRQNKKYNNLIKQTQKQKRRATNNEIAKK